MTTMVRSRHLVDDLDSLWNSLDEPGLPSLVPISDGRGKPVFCVHWGSGNVRFVRYATDSWETDRPIFGFEAVGLRSRARPLLSVNEMAERYLREMRQAQPYGPYTLIGICSGSQIAFEMACLLVHRGESVDDLAVVKGVCPGVSVFDRRCGLEDIFDLRLATLRRDIQLGDLNASIPQAIAWLKARHYIEESVTENLFYAHQLIWSASAYAQEHYPARSYDGPVHAFRSAKDRRGPAAVSWRRVATRTRDCVVDPSNSIAIMQLPEFARIFTQRHAT